MSEYLVQSDSLTAVADAIRTKTGGTDELAFPDGFVSAVAGISAGGFPDEINWETNTYSKPMLFQDHKWRIYPTGTTVYTSNNGYEWSKETMNIAINSAKYSDGLFVAKSGNSLCYSVDGISWNSGKTLPSLDAVCKCTNSNFWYAYGYSNSTYTCYYSVDGKNWTEIEGFNEPIHSVKYYNGLYVMQTAQLNYKSSDGISFTKVEGLASEGSNHCVYFNGTWFFCWNSDYVKLSYSTDNCVTFNVFDTKIRDLVIYDGRLYTFNQNNEILRSEDGIEWVSTGYTAPNSLTSLYVCNGVLFASANTNDYYYSTDGTNWRTGHLPTNYLNISDIQSDGKTFFARGRNSSYQYASFYCKIFE